MTRPMFIFDEITPLIDAPARLQEDIKFIQMLADRCNGKNPVHHISDARVWVHKDELRRLRRIAAVAAWKVKSKNRRIRLETMRGYLAKAEDRLAERAGMLAATALVDKIPANIFMSDFADFKARPVTP